jgi:hypothetical protein
MITVEARSKCLLCGCYLSSFAFPSVRVNRRSLRQLPGFYITCYPGPCPECGHGAGLVPRPEPGESYMASAWRLTAQSAAEVEAYRVKRWPRC